MTDNSPATAPDISPVFAALTGLVSLGILVQAFLAGEFINRDHRHSWITAHDVVATVLMVLALATAIYAVVRFRRNAKDLMGASIALFVLLVVQTGIGHSVTDGDHDALLAIHIPLALFIFGLTVWLSITARVRRRSG
jgi:heme A synthase